MSNPNPAFVENLVGAALRALDPGRLIGRHEDRLRSLGPCRVIAVGKAAIPMAEAAAPILGTSVRGGVLISPAPGPRRETPVPGFEVYSADHPLPTPRNLAAANAAADLVRAVQPDESLVILLSGGASAMLTLPAPGLTLDDLRALTSALLRAGATIDDLNCVRKHCEQLKGGGLARIAVESRCRRVVSLILSDVVGDRLDVIGSGPTAADPTTYADAIGVLDRFGLIDSVPAVTTHLREGAAGKHAETVKPGDYALACVENVIIGSNTIAVEAAAACLREQGCEVVEVRSGVTGEARTVGAQLAERVRGLARVSPGTGCACRAVVWGGETTVTVRGKGAGGRNQELALAASLELEAVLNVAVISFATDGVDGASDAAGAVVDGQSAARARAAGLDPAAALADNDSYGLFSRLETSKTSSGRRILIRTGPTGTNVNDVMIGLWRAGCFTLAGS